jgi:hypothetical protein
MSLLHQRQHRLLQHRQCGGNAQQAHRQRDGKTHRVDIHLRRHARNDAQVRLTNSSSAIMGSAIQRALENSEAPSSCKRICPSACKKLPSTGKLSKLLTTAISTIKCPLMTTTAAWTCAKKPCHSADLRVARRVEERSEVQAHLQTDDFARQLDRRKHQAHRKSNGQPTTTCCATVPKASRPFTLMTGCSPRTPARTVRPETPSPIFTRMGMTRMENTGATKQRPARAKRATGWETATPSVPRRR